MSPNDDRYIKNLINNIMGVSESSQKNCNESLQKFISDVLGSFDCTCKSRCCEYFKCINLYDHCRTNNNTSENEEEEIPQTPLSDNLLN